MRYLASNLDDLPGLTPQLVRNVIRHELGHLAMMVRDGKDVTEDLVYLGAWAAKHDVPADFLANTVVDIEVERQLKSVWNYAEDSCLNAFIDPFGYDSSGSISQADLARALAELKTMPESMMKHFMVDGSMNARPDVIFITDGWKPGDPWPDALPEDPPSYKEPEWVKKLRAGPGSVLLADEIDCDRKRLCDAAFDRKVGK